MTWELGCQYRSVVRRTVKSPPHFLARLLPALVVCTLAAPLLAQQKRQEPGALFGGPSSGPRAPTVLDPWLPVGAEIGPIPERPTTEFRACSARAPVCVHFDASHDGHAPAFLEALESAFRQLVFVLGLPAPAPDRGGGGSDALDLYLTAHDVGLRVAHEGPDGSWFDQAPAFCTLDPSAHGQPARAATLCVAEAIALRLDAAATPHLRRAYATHLWLSVGTPTHFDLEAFDELQSNPQLGLATRDLNPYSEGSALLFEFLERALSTQGPGAVATSLLSVSAAKTSPGSLEWQNEPDLFDVLRSNLENKPRRFAEFFGSLAVSRAFIGERGYGSHLPELAWTGAFGRVRFDWTMKYSSLPRRVAVVRPLQPTGSVYVWLELDDAPIAATLGFAAEWESPATFFWSLVRIDEDGREAGRVNAPFVERGHRVEQTLVGLEGLSAILVVGTNLGGVDLEHPFDPDIAPHEPRGCTVYLTGL